MIKNLNLKLIGQESITIDELFELVNSWGRTDSILNNNIKINKCEPKECYPLENLDVSKIDDMSCLFARSLYNGDLSNWDVGNVKYMNRIFSKSKFNNNSLNYWNISKVETMEYAFWETNFNQDLSNWNFSNCKNIREMFYCSSFDGDISKWNFNKDINCLDVFYGNNNFQNKYNNGKSIPSYYNQDFIIWFEENREKIKEINTHKEEVLDFFSFDKDLELKKD